MDEILPKLAEYKRAVAVRYQALREGELHHIPTGKIWLSDKIDGELWFAARNGAQICLVAPNGRKIESGPLVDRLTEKMSNLPDQALFAGELYDPKGTPRPRVGDVAANLSADGGRGLCWNAFDIVYLGDEKFSTYGEKYRRLQQVFGDSGAVACMPTLESDSRSAVNEVWASRVVPGHSEGLIIRAIDGRIFKMKPRRSVDAVILAYTTRCDEPAQARSLLLGLQVDDAHFVLIGSVGNLGTDENRKALFNTLSGLHRDSAYRHACSEGSLYRFVEPKIVIEVECTDIQGEDSSGQPIKRPALENGKDAWQKALARNTVSLLHPVVLRVRDDKTANEIDAGLAQVSDICVQKHEDAEGNAELPVGEVVRREVWTKASKGSVAVRKVLVCRTNKESAGWPAYVVHFTDYSPSRKTPLDRTVRFGNGREDAEQHAENLIADNIKKGWEKVDSATLADA